MYPALRNVHLFCGALALPALLLYAISAMQMAHTRWFVMQPRISETTSTLQPGLKEGRRVVAEAMRRHKLQGEITSIETQAPGIQARVVVPGTVHEVTYDAGTGVVRVRTATAGFMGMLNRLHHAAGLWPDYLPLRLWAVFVAVVSLATVGLGVTGLWMWWLRRQERKWGLILLTANLAFSVGILLMIRFTR